MAFHKRAVQCELCGQQFFPSSLPFHMKSCVVKQQFVEVPCPHCDEAVRQCDLSHHISKECRVRKTGSKPSIAPARGGGHACAICGRKFAADRLVKHQAICRRNSSEIKPTIMRNIPAAVEELAAPINSNWRAKRDEMKRRIGASKQELRNGKDIEFELVMKSPKNTVEEDREEFCAVLDDSLDGLAELNNKNGPIVYDMSCNSSDLGVSISPSVEESATAWTVEWPRQTVDLPERPFGEPPSRPLDSVPASASAWTVEWPGRRQTGRAAIPAPAVQDPRARFEPVRFEFNPTLSRTTSSFSIPTGILQPNRPHVRTGSKPLRMADFVDRENNAFITPSIRFN